MLLVHTTIPVDPDRREEALDVIRDLTERSRNEPGTVTYRAMTDVVDPNLIRFFELYEDQDAAEAQSATDSYEQFEAMLPELVDGEVETMQVKFEGPLETVRFGVDELQ